MVRTSSRLSQGTEGSTSGRSLRSRKSSAAETSKAKASASKSQPTKKKSPAPSKGKANGKRKSATQASPAKAVSRRSSRKASVVSTARGNEEEKDEEPIGARSEDEFSEEEEEESPADIFSRISKLPKDSQMERPATKKGSRTPKPSIAKGHQLHEMIKAGKAKEAVGEWVKRYQKKPALSTAELINLVIFASGSLRVISEDTFETADLTVLMQTFHTDTYLQSGGDYPLKPGGSTKAGTLHAENYCEFWNFLILACKPTILYDEYLMPSLTAWLVMFSRSELRPFRHVATISSLQIVLSLAGVANTIREQIAAPSRMASAQAKSRPEAAAKLKQKVTEQHQQVIDIEYIINGHYSGIFKRRFRDKFAHIRTLCMRYLGEWMMAYSSVFVSDHYLKYLGWLLHDRDSECRLQAAKALELLLCRTDLVEPISRFVEYHKKRVCSLIYDKDESIIVEGIRISGHLVNHELLEDEQEHLENIYELVADASSHVRYAAAKFVKTWELDVALDAQRVAGESDAHAILRAFLSFLNNHVSSLTELPDYVVDALWDPELWESSKPKKVPRDNPLGYIPLRDWQAMTELLQCDKRHNSLSSAEQELLTRVILATVKRATGHDLYPKSRYDQNVKETPARVVKNKKTITRHFVEVLPDLLSTFKADGAKLEALTEIPAYFDVAAGSLTEKEQASFTALVASLKATFLDRFEVPVLACCVNSFKHLLQEDNVFRDVVESEFIQLQESMATQLSSDVQLLEKLRKELDQGETIEKEQIVTLCDTLGRFEQLVALFQSDSEELLDNCWAVLREYDILPEEAITRALGIVTCRVYWLLAHLAEAPASVGELPRIRDELLEVCFRILSSDVTSDRVKNRACVVALDMLLLFGPNLSGDDAAALRYDVYQEMPGLKDLLATQFEAAMKLDLPEEDQSKLDLVAALARTTLAGAVDPHEFAPLVIGQLLEHGKRADDVVRHFHKSLRETNDPNGQPEGTILLQALRQKHRSAALKEYAAFATAIGSTFPMKTQQQKQMQLQQTLFALLGSGFKLAVTDFPSNLSFLEGMNSLIARLLPAIADKVLEKCMDEIMDHSLELSKKDRTHKPCLVFLDKLEKVAGKNSTTSRAMVEKARFTEGLKTGQGDDDEEEVQESQLSQEGGSPILPGGSDDEADDSDEEEDGKNEDKDEEIDDDSQVVLPTPAEEEPTKRARSSSNTGTAPPSATKRRKR
mmetsp:Transcript_22652/g.89615  ORF Transcript_22652/g.89615 Transcript_22652/m.89615 type:complete len:1215 (-) Transcript_22652:245-3889(-)